ncbi:hypothetical protein HDU97_002289 [Phlyctochytrium planicorne]|nr:hypothetical protein HDU97_002289 [Phlyctochytrium planicorne]
MVALIASAWLVAFSQLAHAGQSQWIRGTSGAVLPGRYIVSLNEDSVVAAGAGVAPLRMGAGTEKESFSLADTLSAVASTKGLLSLSEAKGYQEIKSLFKGVVVDISDPNDAELLKQMEGVRRVVPVRIVQRPSYKVHWQGEGVHSFPSSTAPFFQLRRRDINSNNFTGVTSALNDPSSLRGFAVRVCVIDTGVDFKHPALGGCFGVDCKVAFGYDFVGDAYDPGSRNVSSLIPRPKDSPMDCSGHGTHVAGIIAAVDVEKRGVGGVAPDVTLGAYKIFGCEGNTDTATILSAIDRAVTDGCDVMNLSLGGGAAWYDTQDAELVEMLAEKGLVMVASAGNENDLGLFRINSPAVSKRTIAVGAVENTFYFGRTLTVTNDTNSRPIPFVVPIGSPPGNYSAGLLKASEPLGITSTNDGCSPYPDNYFGGYIALIRRGTCLFTTKIRNAHQANATGIIIYNRLPESLGELPDLYPGFPTLSISGKDGEYLVSRLKQLGNGNVEVKFSKTMSIFPVEGATLPADFTSWGLNNDWGIKPDLVAPGGHILSTWPVRLGGYAVLSGTSMSSPFVAGLSALILSQSNLFAPGDVDTKLLKQAFQTTSVPKNLYNMTDAYGAEVLAPVALQGSGLVDIQALLNNNLVVSPAALSANASAWDSKGKADVKRFRLNVWNSEKVTRRFRLTFLEAAIVAIDDPSSPKVYPPVDLYAEGATNVTVIPPVVDLGANVTTTVDIFVQGPSKSAIASLKTNFTAWMFSGYVFLDEECLNPPPAPVKLASLSVAMAGVVGTFSGFIGVDQVEHYPFLSRTGSGLTEPSTDPNPPRLSITLASSLDALAINLHMMLPSPITVAIVFPGSFSDANTKTWAFNIFDDVITGIDVVPNRMRGAVAVSPSIRLPVSDPDNSNNALYASIFWDGSRDFLGNGTLPNNGTYRVAVVSQNIYSPFSPTEFWLSPLFYIDR